MKSKKNKIIVFANQKGGVGKSTLCILLANYLVYWNRKVCIIDTDLQQSVTVQRQIDSQRFSRAPRYEIQTYPISDAASMQQLMENAQEFDGYVLFDTPGSIKDDGLAVMLAYADAIVCPYEYETKSLVSTQVFITVLEQLRELNPGMVAKLFLVPNKVDTRIGTADEWKAWENYEKEFSSHGLVTPRAGYKVQMRRINTFELLDDHRHAVHKALQFIIHVIEKGTMKNTPNKVNLPAGNMVSAANLATKTVINSEPAVKDPLANPIQSTDKERVHASSLPDDLKVLHDGITKYSSINEHGKGVWVVTDIKKRIDDLNYRTGKKVSIRAFTNAALDFVLSMYGEEIVKAFSQD